MRNFLISCALGISLANSAFAASECGGGITEISKTSDLAFIRDQVGHISQHLSKYPGHRYERLSELDDIRIRVAVDDQVRVFVEGTELFRKEGGVSFDLIETLEEKFETTLRKQGFQAAEKYKKIIDCFYTRSFIRVQIQAVNYSGPMEIQYFVNIDGKPEYKDKNNHSHRPADEIWQREFVFYHYWGETYLDPTGDWTKVN